LTSSKIGGGERGEKTVRRGPPKAGTATFLKMSHARLRGGERRRKLVIDNEYPYYATRSTKEGRPLRVHHRNASSPSTNTQGGGAPAGGK